MSNVRCHPSGHYWYGEPLEVCEDINDPDRGSLWGAFACEFECGFDASYNFHTDECVCGGDSFWSALKSFFVQFADYRPVMWRR